MSPLLAPKVTTYCSVPTLEKQDGGGGGDEGDFLQKDSVDSPKCVQCTLRTVENLTQSPHSVILDTVSPNIQNLHILIVFEDISQPPTALRCDKTL